MLSLSQCKEYLDEETQKELSDNEIIQIRDELQALANITIELMIKNRHKPMPVDYLETNKHENML